MGEELTVEQRLRRIHSSLTDVLHPEGFRRQGARWTLDRGEVVWVILVERGSWNTKDSVIFRPYVAVVVPEVAARILEKEPAKPWHYTDAVIYGSFAEVGARRFRVMLRRRVSYVLKAGNAEADAETIRRLCQQLEDDVLPFLRPLTSLTAVAAYLAQPKPPTNDPPEILRLIHLGAVHAMLGDHVEMHAALARAEALLGDGPRAPELWHERIAAARSLLAEPA